MKQSTSRNLHSTYVNLIMTKKYSNLHTLNVYWDITNMSTQWWLKSTLTYMSIKYWLKSTLTYILKMLTLKMNKIFI